MVMDVAAGSSFNIQELEISLAKADNLFMLFIYFNKDSKTFGDYKSNV